MDPVQQARQAQINQLIAQLPPEVRSAIVAAGVSDAKTVLPVPYWSTVRFAPTIDTTNNLAFIAAQNPRKAFQYAIGGQAQVAGFASSYQPQADETNLLRAGETLDNADVWIYGLCAELCPNSDAAIAMAIWRNAWVELSLNGTTSIRLGTLNMFPSAGGLYGVGQSEILLPPLDATGGGVDGGPGASVSAMANGNPMGGNFMRFPQPFKWCAVGSNGADAQLSVIVNLGQDVSIPIAASSRSAGTGVAAWTQPSTSNAAPVDIRFRLVSVSIGKRSVNT
jgi:hypothetical protein